METQETRSNILDLLLDIGEMMLACGAEVNRVEDTLSRLGTAYGALRMNVFVITSTMLVTMTFPGGRELTQARRITGPGSTNFRRLEALNALSRRCCRAPLSEEALRAEIDRLRTETPKSSLIYGGSMLVAAAFAVFFGGSAPDAAAAALFAALICLLQDRLSPICPNRIIFNFLCSLLCGVGIYLTAALVPVLDADKIIMGDIMLLIPGIAMTNSIRDMLVGDTISGIMRLIESLLWAGALASGFMIAIWLIGG